MNNKDAKNKLKTKKKMNPVAKFLLIVFGIVFSFMIIAGIGVMAYVSNRIVVTDTPRLHVDEGVEKGEDKKSSGNKFVEWFSKVPEQTNFVIFGKDDDPDVVRTDVIILGSFNSKTKKIGLVSVPRDIYVEIPKDWEAKLNEKGIYPADYCKMNEVSVYCKEYGIDSVMNQLEYEFGINLDYYVMVDPEAFRRVVDAVGGVEMTLERSYKYFDPDQNLPHGFRIDLEPGTQLLDGAAAEGLVRYRADYAGGDLERIEVQQKFMGELFRQVLSRDAILSNAPEILNVILDTVETNMTIAQATKYLPFLPALSANNIDMYALTGDSFRYGPDNLSYLRLNRDDAQEKIDEVFFNTPITPPENSKNLKIAVLNGSGTAGLAKQTQDMLAEEGYNVVQIGDFTGERVSGDRIFVKQDGFGEDLKTIFKGSEIIVDKDMVREGSDITVVMGIDAAD